MQARADTLAQLPRLGMGGGDRRRHDARPDHRRAGVPSPPGRAHRDHADAAGRRRAPPPVAPAGGERAGAAGHSRDACRRRRRTRSTSSRSSASSRASAPTSWSASSPSPSSWTRRRSRSGWPRAGSTPSCGQYAVRSRSPAARPSSVEVKVPLTGPAAEGAELVAANVGQARWPRWLSPAVLAVSLLAALLLWRRGGAPQPRHEMAFGPFPTAAHAQPPAAPVPARPPPDDLEITAQPVDVETTDQTDPERTGEWVARAPGGHARDRKSGRPRGRRPGRADGSCPFRTRRDLAGPLGFGVAVAACARATAAVHRSEGRDRFEDRRVARPVRRVREAPADDRRADRGPGCRSLRRDAAGEACRRS